MAAVIINVYMEHTAAVRVPSRFPISIRAVTWCRISKADDFEIEISISHTVTDAKHITKTNYLPLQLERPHTQC
jgi:hypothetical protein